MGAIERHPWSRKSMLNTYYRVCARFFPVASFLANGNSFNQEISVPREKMKEIVGFFRL
jgi:hypothetical protein